MHIFCVRGLLKILVTQIKMTYKNMKVMRNERSLSEVHEKNERSFERSFKFFSEGAEIGD